MKKRPNQPYDPFFVRLLLDCLGYQKDRTLLTGPRPLTLQTSDGIAKLTFDICVQGVGKNWLILLVVEEDTPQVDAEAQLIIKAVASVQHNNKGPYCPKNIMGLIICGTYLSLYKIPATLALDKSIRCNKPLSSPATVYRFAPGVPKEEGIVLLSSREYLARCLQGARQLLVTPPIIEEWERERRERLERACRDAGLEME